MTSTPLEPPALAPRDLAHAYGTPPTFCLLRAQASDFRVEEVLGLEPDGAGEHLLLHLEKTGANTPWVARQLARWADVAPGDVSYSGMKDRHAVTSQWFSIRLGGRCDPSLETLVIEGVRVLAKARHGRKLRRGTHRANRFVLTLREVSGDVCERASKIFDAGVPNYFGPQRYGRRNLDEARALFSGDRRRRRSREQRAMAMSAARSYLFDLALGARVAVGSWDQLRAGDAAILDGSASWFEVAEVDAVLRERLERFDVHPSGPLWGEGALATAGEVAAGELAVAEAHPDLAQGLVASGSRQQRRALRVRPAASTIEQHGAVAELRFTLPAGSYATSVVRELSQADEPDRGAPKARAET